MLIKRLCETCQARTWHDNEVLTLCNGTVVHMPPSCRICRARRDGVLPAPEPEFIEEIVEVTSEDLDHMKEVCWGYLGKWNA